MKNLFQIAVFVFASVLLPAQQPEASDTVRLEAAGEITGFDTDDFNNIYYIRNSTEFNKIEIKTGNRLSFSNRSILESPDVRNLLRITLRSDFFSLIILDNRLNPIMDPIKLDSNPDFSPTLTAVTDNNYLWGYDPVLQRLLFWNYRESKLVRQSMILNAKDSAEFFSALYYDSNRIFLAGTDSLLIFDEFANLQKKIGLPKYIQLEVYDNRVFYSTDEGIYRLDPDTGTGKKLIPADKFDFFSINKSYLFVLKDKVVYLYDSQNFF